jgi:hypothetical protein
MPRAGVACDACSSNYVSQGRCTDTIIDMHIGLCFSYAYKLAARWPSSAFTFQCMYNLHVFQQAALLQPWLYYDGMISLTISHPSRTQVFCHEALLLAAAAKEHSQRTCQHLCHELYLLIQATAAHMLYAWDQGVRMSKRMVLPRGKKGAGQC